MQLCIHGIRPIHIFTVIHGRVNTVIETEKEGRKSKMCEWNQPQWPCSCCL